jgi:hypothetical protein
MNYQLKQYELEIQSKEFPHLNYAQFEQYVEKATLDFVGQMAKLGVQFVAQPDMSRLGCVTKFWSMTRQPFADYISMTVPERITGFASRLSPWLKPMKLTSCYQVRSL